MYKKFWGFVLAVFVLFSATSSYADGFCHYYGDTVCVFDSPGESFVGDNVNVLMKNTEDSSILHIGNCTVDSDGSYFYKFNCNSLGDVNINDCIVCVQIADEAAQRYAITQKPDNMGLYKISSENDALMNTKMKIRNLFDKQNNLFLIPVRRANDDNIVSLNRNSADLCFGWKGASNFIDVPYVSDSHKLDLYIWDGLRPIQSKYQVNNADIQKFEDGDVVSITGDSTVHLSTLPAFMEHFYQTRYPQKYIRIVNTGIGGNYVNNVLDRLEEDVYAENPNKVYIQCGINDLGYTYSPENSEIDGARKVAFDKCINNYATLMSKVKDDGKSLTVFGGALYDEGDYDNAKETVCTGLQNAMHQLAGKLDVLTTENDIEFFDINTYSFEVTNLVRETNPTACVISGTDRIHPTEGGYTVLAALTLLHQGNNSIVSQTEIDVTDGTESTYNASVEITECSEENVRYLYNPKAIPIAASSWYTKADELIPVTELLNREIIKVNGLSDGNYNIAFTDENGGNFNLGSFTNAELSNGVNIAVNANNPSQIQSKLAMNKQMERFWAERGLRAMVSRYYSYTDKMNPDEPIPEEKPTPQEIADKRCDVKTLSDEARALSVPKAYTVNITRIN